MRALRTAPDRRAVRANVGDGAGWPHRSVGLHRPIVGRLDALPACSNAPLKMALRLTGYDNILQQVSVTHCFTFTSKTGRTVVAFVQDILVPGLKAEAKLGGPVEIYAAIFAYVVEANRSGHYPMYGDVLAFDLILWAQREFGVEGNFRMADYDPGEMPTLFRLVAKLSGKKKRQYKSLKVRDLVSAIERKRWPE